MQNNQNWDDKLFKFRKHTNKKITTSLSGKPKKLATETIKRYLKNPYVVIATLLFFIILIVSSWTATTAKIIDAPISSDLDQLLIKDLPPVGTNQVRRFDITNLELRILQSAQNDFPNLIKNIGPITLDGKASYVDLDLTTVFAKSDLTRPILGTNSGSSDIWVDSLTSIWESIKIALVVTTIESIFGVVIGLYLGYHVGTWIDTVFTRLVEIIRSVPLILWFIILVSIFGFGFWSLVLAFIVIGWIGPVFNARLFIITIKDKEFIIVAKSLGVPKWRVILVHAFPIIAGKILNSYVRRIPDVIFLVAALSFLGFKTGHTLSIGTYLHESRTEINYWSIVFPSLILLSFSLSIQFISIGIHDALDPRLK